MSKYHLEVVPQPPMSSEWADSLRWLIAVMDNDDPDLYFIAGLYSYCTSKDGLTARQEKFAEKILRRVELQFDGGSLDFQRKIAAV